MNVFSQLQRDNDLKPDELDELVNKSFIKLSEKYKQFDMEYNEDGISISNFEQCDDEETGGFDKEQVESNLTDELIELCYFNAI